MSSAEPAIAKTPWALILLIVTGGFMAGLDTSLVSVGLTTITADLHARSGGEWVTSAYLLSLAAVLPACSWMQRRWGGSLVWRVSLIVFVIASLLCALAPSMIVLILARVLQGAAAGILVPTGQALTLQRVDRSRMGRTMSIAGIPLMLAPAIGPALGGLLIDALSWQWLFLVNIPIGAVILILAPRALPRTSGTRGERLDVWGWLTLALGLSLLSWGLTRFGQSPPTPGILAAAAGTALIAGYVVRGLRRNPDAGAPALFNLRLFARPRFWIAQITVFLTGAGLFGGLILLPLYLQTVRGFSVIATGVFLFGYGLGAMGAAIVGGRLIDRIGAGATAIWGLTLTLVTAVPFLFLDATTPLWLVQALFTVRGIGVGMAGIPAMTAVMRAAPDAITDATTTSNIVQRVGGSLGNALVVVLVSGTATVIAGFPAAFALLAAIAAAALVAAVFLTGWER